MDIEDAIQNLLELSRVTGNHRDSQGLSNAFSDKLRAHSLSLDFIQDCVDYLLDSIVFQIDPVIRGHQFDMVEEAYRKNPSVDIDLDQIILLFDESDLSLIANTLLLFPVANNKAGKIELARKYCNSDDQFVRKNARYAIEHLSKAS